MVLLNSKFCKPYFCTFKGGNSKALEFDEQLSRLQKPDRNEMTDEQYEIFN